MKKDEINADVITDMSLGILGILTLVLLLFILSTVRGVKVNLKIEAESFEGKYPFFFICSRERDIDVFKVWCNSKYLPQEDEKEQLIKVCKELQSLLKKTTLNNQVHTVISFIKTNKSFNEHFFPFFLIEPRGVHIFYKIERELQHKTIGYLPLPKNINFVISRETGRK